MTEYTSSNRIVGTLIQIKDAIKQLQDWNKDVQTVDDYYCTPEGMKNLAASCMLIEAIGEGVKLIDRLTQSRLFLRSINSSRLKKSARRGLRRLEGTFIGSRCWIRLPSIIPPGEYTSIRLSYMSMWISLPSSK